MSDKLIAIKIKQQDGSWMGPIPISVFAENVIWDEDNGIRPVLLTDVLGDVDLTKGTVQQQIDNCILTSRIASIEEARSYLNLAEDENGESGGNSNNLLSNDVKRALLDCFNNVVWANANGQEYYNALRDALYPQQAG